MPKRKSKKKIKVGNLILFIIVFCVLVGGLLFGGNKLLSFVKEKTTINNYYLASITPEVNLYSYDNETEIMSSLEVAYRGTLVQSANKTKIINDTEYLEITLQDQQYYVLNTAVVDSFEDCVLEKEKFVRTSVTVYKNETDSKIESFIKKGNQLEILDYDKLDEYGNVGMYKIKYNDVEGWVYEKYLVDTLEEAQANYNENGVYDTHKNRKFSYELYGGKATNLDYYPYEKVEFVDNPLLKEAKTMYLNAGADTMKNINKYRDCS